MTKIFSTILFGLFLTGCNSSDDDLKLDGLSDALKFCVQESASENGVDSADEITSLNCSLTEPVSGEVEKLSRYPKLTELVVSLSASVDSIALDDFLQLQKFSCFNCELIEFSVGSGINQTLTDLELNSAETINKVNLEGAEALERLTLLTNVNRLFLPFDSALTHLVWHGDWNIADQTVQVYDLDLSHSLQQLVINGVAIEYLDLTQATDLVSVDIVSSALKSAYFNSQKLESIIIIDGQMEDIDLGLASQLRSLSLVKQRLTDIDLDDARNLEFVSLQENPLSDDTIAYLQSIDWIETINY